MDLHAENEELELQKHPPSFPCWPCVYFTVDKRKFTAQSMTFNVPK